MPKTSFLAIGSLLLAAALALAPTPARAQDGPPPEVRRAISRLIDFLESQGDAALQEFAAEATTTEYRSSFSGDGFMDHLRALRGAGHGRTGDVTVERGPGDGLTLNLEDGVRYHLYLDDQGLVTRLELRSVVTEGPAVGGPNGPGPADPVTWDGLEARLEAEAAAGLSGAIVARRGGREIVRRALGLADPSTGRPIRLETAFGIGSTPIDFTVAAALILADRGVLRLDDPVGRFVPEVPADKAGLTIGMILEGRSGLPDFHDTGADWDPDLAWIDRDTALRRIMTQPLLFEPGTESAHSHSAYVLLAAIIELASGESYRAFVRREILDPVGMGRTGFYGEHLGLAIEDFAVGAGPSRVGLPNIPPNWGPTSWLVMGSGGMFSTLGDMDRFYTAVAAGRVVPEAYLDRFPLRGFFVGGSDRGFYFFRGLNGDGDSVLMLANVDGRTDRVRALTRALASLAGAMPR